LASRRILTPCNGTGHSPVPIFPITKELAMKFSLDDMLNAFAGCQNLRLSEIVFDGKKIQFKTVYRDAEQSHDPASKWIETDGKG